jgi:hypothetical protein
MGKFMLVLVALAFVASVAGVTGVQAVGRAPTPIPACEHERAPDGQSGRRLVAVLNFRQ